MNKKLKSLAMLLSFSTLGIGNTSCVSGVQAKNETKVVNTSNCLAADYNAHTALLKELCQTSKLVEYLTKTGKGSSNTAKVLNEKLLKMKLQYVQQEFKSLSANVNNESCYNIEKYTNDKLISTLTYYSMIERGFTEQNEYCFNKLTKTDEYPKVFDIINVVKNENASDLFNRSGITVTNVDININGMHFVDGEFDTEKGKEKITFSFGNLGGKLVLRYETYGRCYTNMVTEVPAQEYFDKFVRWHTPEKGSIPKDYDFMPWPGEDCIGKKPSSGDILPEDYFNFEY